MWDALWTVLISELSGILGVEKYTNPHVQAFGTEQVPYYGSYRSSHKRVEIIMGTALCIYRPTTSLNISSVLQNKSWCSFSLKQLKVSSNAALE